MSEQIFAYGTLRDPSVQQAVIGRVVAGTPDALVGFRRTTIELEGTVYPIVVHDTPAEIAGVILSVTADELARIDDYETDADQRTRVTLESGRQAGVYRA